MNHINCKKCGKAIVAVGCPNSEARQAYSTCDDCLFCVYCNAKIEDRNDAVRYKGGEYAHEFCDEKASDYMHDYALAIQDYEQEGD